MRFAAVNLFTGLRIPLAVAVYLMVLDGRWEIAVCLLFAGLFTDLLDGPLARKLKVESRFGYHLDGQSDRLLVLAPIVGMAAATDIPIAFAAVLASGLYLADLLAKRFELMRVVWWPLCYLTITYGVVTHTSWQIWLTVLAAGYLAADIVMRLKPDQTADARKTLHL